MQELDLFSKSITNFLIQQQSPVHTLMDQFQVDQPKAHKRMPIFYVCKNNMQSILRIIKKNNNNDKSKIL